MIHLPTEVVKHLRTRQATGIDGYDLVIPEFNFQDQAIHRLIYDPEIGIKTHSLNIREEAVALWHKALDFFNEKHVSTILLGYTEIPLLNRRDEKDTILKIKRDVAKQAVV